ncbi:hypothetical protein OK016_26305 [Vibrio chagasii]|nr:hypothetical protein [Vibrio chagasii]
MVGLEGNVSDNETHLAIPQLILNSLKRFHQLAVLFIRTPRNGDDLGSSRPRYSALGVPHMPSTSTAMYPVPDSSPKQNESEYEKTRVLRIIEEFKSTRY